MSDASDLPTMGPDDSVPSPPPRDRAGPLPAGTVVGRYVVIEHVGSGGMGMVLSAFDPELDRKVALKLVRPGGSRGGSVSGARNRLLREAQLLAKLSHPNVVTVHDVGEYEGSVFLAMEFVQGDTLTDWGAERTRSWRETLEVYVRAGRGLAAAHAQGLVHRDFKPDNVMIDAAGRVRVMDFGLARRDDVAPDAAGAPASDPVAFDSLATTLTRGGELMGTPSYMSPEQWARREVDAKSDQFSFCVALFEALYGARPFDGKSIPELATQVTEGDVRPPPRGPTVPRWLRRAVLRGLSPDAEDRHASMDGLLEVLSEGRARGRLRIAAAATVFAAGGVATGLWFDHLAGQRQRQHCDALADAVFETWDTADAGALRQAFVATGKSFAAPTASTVIAKLDRVADGWAQARREACMAEEVDDAWSPEIAASARWCFDERRVYLDVAVAALRSIDTESLAHAVAMSGEVGDVALCADPAVLVRLRPPPGDQRDSVLQQHRQVASAMALANAGRIDDALPLARKAQQQALALGWGPLTATASRTLGMIQTSRGELGLAETALEDAFFTAREVGADDLAADAATILVDVVGAELGRHDEGVRWGRHAEVALAALGEGSDLARAALGNNVGRVLRLQGKLVEARARIEGALEIRSRRLGENHPDVAALLASIGLVAWDAGSYEEAEQLHRRALEINKRAFGVMHPKIGHALNNLGILHESVGHYDRADVLASEALSIFEAAYGSQHPDVAMSLNNLGVVALALDQPARARRLHARAGEIWAHTVGEDHPSVALSLMNLANATAELGETETARELYERALTLQRRALGPQHKKVADVLNNLGVNRFEAGEFGEAVAYYREALTIMERALGPSHIDTATALDNLAEAMAGRGDLAPAEAAHRRALEIREAALGPDHADLAYSLIGLAKVALASERGADAVAPARRALRIRVRAEADRAQLAVARFVLARALWADGEGDERRRAAAIAEARTAVDDYGDDPIHAAGRAEVARWLHERRSTRASPK